MKMFWELRIERLFCTFILFHMLLCEVNMAHEQEALVQQTANDTTALEAPVFVVDFREARPIIRLGANRYSSLIVDQSTLTKDGLRHPLPARNILPAFIAHPDTTRGNWIYKNCKATATAIDGCDKGGLRLSFAPQGGSIHSTDIKFDNSKLVTPLEKGYSYVFSCNLRAESRDLKINLVFSGNANGVDKQSISVEQSVEVTLPANQLTRAAVIIDFPEDTVPEAFKISINFAGIEDTLSSDNSVVDVCIDSLQVERGRNYPVFQTQPSDWMPGGTNRGSPLSVSSLAEHLLLNETEGTIVLRLKPDPVLPGFSLGDCAWFSIGAGWDVVAELNDESFRLGKSVLRFPAISSMWPDGDFHQIALVWNTKTISLFRNGILISEEKRTAPLNEILLTERMKTMNILFGQATSRIRTNQGTLAYFAAYDRALPAERLVALAATKGVEAKENILLSLPQRSDFTRDEVDVSLSMQLLNTNGTLNGSASLQVDIYKKGDDVLFKEVDDFITQQINANTFCVLIPINTQAMMPGEYRCIITLINEGNTQIYHQPFTIHAALPSNSYGLMIWGVGTDHNKWQRYQSEGASIIDTGGYAFPSVVQNAGAMDLTISAHVQNFLHSPHPAAPDNWSRIMHRAQVDAAAIARASHRVRYALLNSEVFGSSNIKSSPRMLKDLKEQIDLWEPPLSDEAGKFGLASRPKFELKAYAKTGIVPSNLPELKFLEWLADRGNGVSPVNAEIIHTLKQRTPKLRVLGEPAHAFIFHYGLYEGRDLVGAWCYELDLGAVQRRFSAGQAYARHYGCGFYPIIGYVYSVMDKDGFEIGDGQKMIDPSLSPDAARARLWLSLAQPAELICIWSYESYNPQGWKENQIHPGLYNESARTMRLINRLGPVYGPLKWKRPPLALFASFTTQIGLGSERWWHEYGIVVGKYGQILNSANARYDLLLESDIRAGRLDSYKTILAPSLRYLPEDIHEKITAWSADGGQVVVDRLANPALQYANQQTIAGLSDTPNGESSTDKTKEALVSDWAHELTTRHEKAYSVRADSEDVMVVVKEAGQARYVIVINNRWQMRPAPNLRISDVGVGQKTALRLVDPAFADGKSAFVYDAVEGKSVRIKRENGAAVWDCALEPGEGRLYAVYTSEIATLDAQLAGENPEGNPEQLIVRILDPHGNKVEGRQGLELEILTPAGERHDSSGIYAVDNGIATVPLRLYVGAQMGKWSVSIREIASSIFTTMTIDVQ